MCEKMAASRKKRVRFTIDINFAREADKEAFSERLKAVRDLLTPRGSQTLNNYELLLALFDQVGRDHSSAQSSHQPDKFPSSGSFLRNSGQFVILHSETL